MARVIKSILVIAFFFFMVVIFAIVLNKYFGVLTLKEIESYVSDYKYKKQREEEYMAYQLELQTLLEAAPLEAEIGYANSVPIINYHGVSDTKYKEDILTENFKNHIFALKAAGYETITLQEFIDFVEGKATLPQKSIMITFDDGLKSSYENATPILEVADYTAVMFIITKYSTANGTSYYISLDEAKEMLASGVWELQVHANDSHDDVKISSESYGHYLSNKIWLEDKDRVETDEEYQIRVANEFRSSFDDYVTAFGTKPISFAFPFGDYGHISKNNPQAKNVILKELAPYFYTANFFQTWPAQGSSHNLIAKAENNLYKRISVNSSWSDETLLEVISHGYEKDLRYKDALESDNGWELLWGDYAVENGLLALRQSGNASAGIYLDGSSFWDDYEVVTDVEKFSGTSLSLVFNFVDKQNFDVCEFTPTRIRIERLRNAEHSILYERRINIPLTSGEPFEVGYINKDDTVTCFFDGTELATLNLIPQAKSDKGGVGFIIWDSEGQTELFVSEISARNLKVQ